MPVTFKIDNQTYTGFLNDLGIIRKTGKVMECDDFHSVTRLHNSKIVIERTKRSVEFKQEREYFHVKPSLMDFNISRMNNYHNLDVLKNIILAEKLHETINVQEKSHPFEVLPSYGLKPYFKVDFIEQWKEKVESWKAKAITAVVCIMLIPVIVTAFSILNKFYTLLKIISSLKAFCCKPSSGTYSLAFGK